MNKNTEGRVVRQSKTEVDLLVPISQVTLPPVEEGDCFGKMWDIKHTQCQVCADSEICGILFSEKVADREAEIEKENNKFLDSSDWAGLEQTDLRIWLAAKTRSVEDFLDYILVKANTTDETAAVEYIKRFVAANDNISIKKGQIIVKS